MLEYRYRTIKPSDFHSHFTEMPDPPKNLWIAGDVPPLGYKMLCVVGARSYSSYGHEVCTHLIGGLEGYPVCIVSGLALGIDTIAHEIALEAGLPTIAFPGSGLAQKVLYPARNRILAQRITDNKGCLVSEFPPDMSAQEWTFPQRNRLMAGCADVVLIIEGSQRSGTNITARLGLDYNKTVCAVPGSIFSSLSHVSHELIQEGAFPITSSKDLLHLLNLTEHVSTPSISHTMNEVFP